MNTQTRNLKTTIAAAYDYLDSMSASTATRRARRYLLLVQAQMRLSVARFSETLGAYLDAMPNPFDADLYGMGVRLGRVHAAYRHWLSRSEYSRAYRLLRELATCDAAIADARLYDCGYAANLARRRHGELVSEYMSITSSTRHVTEDAFHWEMSQDSYADGTWVWRHGTPYRYEQLVNWYIDGIDADDCIPF